MFKKIFYWGGSPLKIEGIELSSEKPDPNNPDHDPRKILLINLDNKMDSGKWNLGWGKGSWELNVGNKLGDMTQILSSDIKQKKALKDISKLISYLLDDNLHDSIIPELNEVPVDTMECNTCDGKDKEIPSYEELQGRLRAALIELEALKKIYTRKLDK